MSKSTDFRRLTSWSTEPAVDHDLMGDVCGCRCWRQVEMPALFHRYLENIIPKYCYPLKMHYVGKDWGRTAERSLNALAQSKWSKLVSGWGLMKRRSVPPCGSSGLGKTLHLWFYVRYTQYACEPRRWERVPTRAEYVAVLAEAPYNTQWHMALPLKWSATSGVTAGRRQLHVFCLQNYLEDGPQIRGPRL